ncbi:MAG TPA: formate dehydrogenase subunit gamma, partial [Usitatibacteraceae bacterium]|nr:formate dehydrogenase subunit gamma [Usitatibacteraceae bacterium]
FNSMDRMAHWSVAISFIVLALTGMVTLFGKYVLLPVLGASLFANIAQITTVIHNFVGPLFIFSLIVMFFVYVKDNFMGGSDFAWITHATGLFSHHQVPSGRFNGMEKVWFWMATLVLGVIISVSGLILLFPNWNTSREIMAGANIFHSVTAVVFLAGALAHIYMGIATEGAMEGMKEGYVDESWAKEHHELWYNEVQSGKPGGGNLAAQPAAGDD